MAREQKIRAVLFYLSLSVFLVGLPFIISFALGLVFNPQTLTFTKTGLIVLKTQPQGAMIHLNGRLLREKTPATIYELLPGKYSVRLELNNYYAWSGGVTVDAGKVANLDKIIFFPIRANIEQLNQGAISAFWLDALDNAVYYLDEDQHTIYKSDLDGQGFTEIGSLTGLSAPLKGFKLSPDKKKLLCFNQRRLEIVLLDEQDDSFNPGSGFILDYPDRRISDIFWHSDSYHIIVVTNKNIEVLEGRPQAGPVNLINLNKKNGTCFYDTAQDVLYFEDSQKAEDGKLFDFAYKLDLSSKFSSIKDLVKFRADLHEER